MSWISQDRPSTWFTVTVIGTFQIHEGLHRFNVLFFGAVPATELFHDRVKAALAELPRCTPIYHNNLV